MYEASTSSKPDILLSTKKKMVNEIQSLLRFRKGFLRGASWHMNYFELKAIKNLQSQEKASPLP